MCQDDYYCPVLGNKLNFSQGVSNIPHGIDNFYDMLKFGFIELLQCFPLICVLPQQGTALTSRIRSRVKGHCQESNARGIQDFVKCLNRGKRNVALKVF